MELEEIKKMSELEDTHWWFSAKRRLVLDAVDLLKPKKILDIGCGTGSNLAAFSGKMQAYGCEYSYEAIRLCIKRGKFPLVKCSAETLPFRDGSFDAATLLDVIEHVDKDVDALSEVHRILAKGGHAIISVPAHKFLWEAHDVVHHHKRRYVASELRHKIQKAGFKIVKMTYWNLSLFLGSAAYSKFSKGSNIKKHSKLTNSIFHRIANFDNTLIRHGINLPFGVSLFCIARKV